MKIICQNGNGCYSSFRADASKFVIMLFKAKQRVSNLSKVGNPKIKP
jgi:hypothetical protein